MEESVVKEYASILVEASCVIASAYEDRGAAHHATVCHNVARDINQR
jgi:hypothetical protein